MQGTDCLGLKPHTGSTRCSQMRWSSSGLKHTRFERDFRVITIVVVCCDQRLHPTCCKNRILRNLKNKLLNYSTHSVLFILFFKRKGNENEIKFVFVFPWGPLGQDESLGGPYRERFVLAALHFHCQENMFA